MVRINQIMSGALFFLRMEDACHPADLWLTRKAKKRTESVFEFPDNVVI